MRRSNMKKKRKAAVSIHVNANTDKQKYVTMTGISPNRDVQVFLFVDWEVGFSMRDLCMVEPATWSDPRQRMTSQGRPKTAPNSQAPQALSLGLPWEVPTRTLRSGCF